MRGGAPLTSLAFLVDQLFSPVPGGMGTYVRELVPALARADPSLEVTLFHARFGEAARSEPWTAAFPTVVLPGSIRRLYPSWAALSRPPLPPPLDSRDLVHSPVPAAVPPTAPGQRLVVTVHDVAFLAHPELFPLRWRAMYRAGLARALRKAHAVIAVSRHTAQEIPRLNGRRPGVHVVPLAVSPPEPAGHPEEALRRLGIQRPFVLFVGTLEARKNLVRLVKACRGVSRRVPHTLVLAGPPGWGHRAVFREIARGGPDGVVVTGHLTPGDLDALYRETDAFVYPSLYEGFGLPVLEAMARGAPCIVSRTSSLPEVAGDAALLVEPGSVADIARAVEVVLTDGGVADRLRQAGPGRASRFSWDETARRTLDVYRSVL